MKITCSLILFLIILPAGFSPGQDILPFEPGDTLEEIRYKIDHNGYSFEVSDNWVFNMSPAEKSRFFSRRAPAFARAMTAGTGIGPLESRLGTVVLPETFDWRNYNGHAYIGDIRNQGNCGSCYAFGAAAAAEGSYNWITGSFDGNRSDFSEAFIAFCLSDHYSGFDGCSGASYDYDELQALVDYGICTETQYPYTDIEQTCPLSPYPPLTQFQSWHRVPCNDINAIKTAIMTYGVVDAAVYAGSAFSGYAHGIYEDTNTACDGSPCAYTTSNHAIALVGWDNTPPEGGGGVWILRNSWGTGWGESGYMRIRYTSAVVGCAVAYLVYQSPTSPTPTPFGYKTPTPTPPWYNTPSPTPTVTLTPFAPPPPTPILTPDPTPTCGPAVPHPDFLLSGGDFDGDGTSDPAVLRDSAGLWAIRGVTRAYFGSIDDSSVSGDYNGDGTTDIAIFRASAGLWAIQGISRIYLGSANEFPCPSDYDGDGIADIAVFQAESGRWAIREITRIYFGRSDDRPIPGDYTGSGSANIAIFRSASGLWALSDISRIYFGGNDDWPIPADYDGDGTSDISIFRPRSSSLWAIRGMTRVYFGNCLDWPVPADYRGKGIDDIGIFRETSGLWAIRGITRAYFGSSGDIPITR